MKKLAVKEAYAYLMEASQFNPGPWVDHSLHVGKAARAIAERIDLDPDLAEAYGYIHDIGRRYGIMKMRHSLMGYRFMEEEGYSEAAKICITHSFPTQKMEDAVGEWDCSQDEYLSVKNILAEVEFTPYDELIQLCDSMALPSGVTLVERRLIDIALRYGVKESEPRRWRRVLTLQKSIEEKLGYSIYDLFPEVGGSLNRFVAEELKI